MSIIFDFWGDKSIGSDKKKHIGAVQKTFKTKSELLKELKRLYALQIKSMDKEELDYSGRFVNPKQVAASNRMQRRISKLIDNHPNLITTNEWLPIATKMYVNRNKKQ